METNNKKNNLEKRKVNSFLPGLKRNEETALNKPGMSPPNPEFISEGSTIDLPISSALLHNPTNKIVSGSIIY